MTAFEEDEPPTKPDASTDPHKRIVMRLLGECCNLDRKRLARLVEAWYCSTLEQRILLESLAFEFVRDKPQ